MIKFWTLMDSIPEAIKFVQELRGLVADLHGVYKARMEAKPTNAVQLPPVQLTQVTKE